MQRTILRSFAIVGLSALFSTACGGDDDGQTGGGTDDSTSSDDNGNPTSNTVSATTPSTSVDDTTEPDTTADTVNPDTSSTSETAGATAQVRVVHAAPGAGNVDVYAMGSAEPLAADVAYGTATTYVEVPAGDVVIEIRAAGDPADSEPVYTSDAITLDADSQSTAVAAGVVGGEADSAFRVLALNDAWETPAAGTARVRVLHAGADAPAVDIDLGNDGTPEIEGLERFTATDEAGVELPADMPMSVGILADGNRITQFSVPGLPDGTTVLVAATGLVVALPREVEGLGLLPVLTDGALGIIPQDPRVYALHSFFGVGPADTDVSEVDVCLEDAVLLDNLTWADVATSLGSFQVAPGNYDITLQVGSEDCAGTPVFGPAATGALDVGQQYLVAVGSDEDGEIQLIVGQEDFSLDLDPQAAIRGANASDLGTMYIGAVEKGLVDDLVTRANGEISGESPLDAGSLLLGVSIDTGATHDVLAQADVEIVGGERMWIIAAGSGDAIGSGEENDRLRLRMVDTSSHPAPWTVTDVILEAP